MDTDSSNETVSEVVEAPAVKEISKKALVDYLKNGVTRRKGDTGYCSKRGSIQEIYALTATEVNDIFKDPQLAGLKVKVPKKRTYVLIEDLPVTDVVPGYEKQIAEPVVVEASSAPLPPDVPETSAEDPEESVDSNPQSSNTEQSGAPEPAQVPVLESTSDQF